MCFLCKFTKSAQQALKHTIMIDAIAIAIGKNSIISKEK